MTPSWYHPWPPICLILAYFTSAEIVFQMWSVLNGAVPLRGPTAAPPSPSTPLSSLWTDGRGGGVLSLQGGTGHSCGSAGRKDNVGSRATVTVKGTMGTEVWGDTGRLSAPAERWSPGTGWGEGRSPILAT